MSYCQEAELGLMAMVASLTADLVWFDGRMGRRRLHLQGGLSTASALVDFLLPFNFRTVFSPSKFWVCVGTEGGLSLIPRMALLFLCETFSWPSCIHTLGVPVHPCVSLTTIEDTKYKSPSR